MESAKFAITHDLSILDEIASSLRHEMAETMISSAATFFAERRAAAESVNDTTTIPIFMINAETSSETAAYALRDAMVGLHAQAFGSVLAAPLSYKNALSELTYEYTSGHHPTVFYFVDADLSTPASAAVLTSLASAGRLHGVVAVQRKFGPAQVDAQLALRVCWRWRAAAPAQTILGEMVLRLLKADLLVPLTIRTMCDLHSYITENSLAIDDVRHVYASLLSSSPLPPLPPLRYTPRRTDLVSAVAADPAFRTSAQTALARPAATVLCAVVAGWLAGRGEGVTGEGVLRHALGALQDGPWGLGGPDNLDIDAVNSELDNWSVYIEGLVPVQHVLDSAAAQADLTDRQLLSRAVSSTSDAIRRDRAPSPLHVTANVLASRLCPPANDISVALALANASVREGEQVFDVRTLHGILQADSKVKESDLAVKFARVVRSVGEIISDDSATSRLVTALEVLARMKLVRRDKYAHWMLIQDSF